MRNKIEYLCEHVDTVPIEDEDFRLDTGLARVATELAVERHAASNSNNLIHPRQYVYPIRQGPY